MESGALLVHLKGEGLTPEPTALLFPHTCPGPTPTLHTLFMEEWAHKCCNKHSFDLSVCDPN